MIETPPKARNKSHSMACNILSKVIDNIRLFKLSQIGGTFRWSGVCSKYYIMKY